jgi:hypothetical protein
MTAEQVTYLLGEIRQNLEDWIVTGYQPITINSLPEPKDVHVVQAAVKSVIRMAHPRDRSIIRSESPGKRQVNI